MRDGRGGVVYGRNGALLREDIVCQSSLVLHGKRHCKHCEPWFAVKVRSGPEALCLISNLREVVWRRGGFSFKGTSVSRHFR